MKKLTTIVAWVALIIVIQILFWIIYAAFETGLDGPFVCRWAGSCDLYNYILDEVVWNNVFFGLPTIFSGLIAWLGIKVWREGIAR